MKSRTVAVLVALSVSLACGTAPAGDAASSAIGMVAQEISNSNPARSVPSDLAATRIPRGEGMVVYVKNYKEQRLAWVVLAGQAYTCTDEAKQLTPRLRKTTDALWDTWKQTGLDPGNTASFFRIIDEAEARVSAR